MSKKTQKIVGIILLILIADQTLKIWIKTHLALGEDIEIFSWAHIHFLENNGMAFGMEVISKTFLSIFRIVAVGGIGYGIYHLLRKNYSFGFIACMAMIFAGALGNIIDCLFYGLIFEQSSFFHIAQIFPDGGGYAPFLHGRVVDMFYFPIIESTFPQWIPYIGGKDFIFFSPVFNLADSAISVGVVCILLFFQKDLKKI